MILFLGLAILTGCATKEKRLPYSVPEERFADSLGVIRVNYDSLRLWEALAAARRLSIGAKSDSIRSDLRIELYQYLTMLHFDRSLYRDSITFYFNLAETEFSADEMDLQLQARQALCQAYQNYVEWAYHEMELNARYGQQLIQNASEESLLLGLLKTAEGRGRKQRAYRAATLETRHDGLISSEGMLRNAALAFRRIQSPWERHPLDHLALVLIQQGKRDREVRSLVDSIDAGKTLEDRIHGFRERILGYMHYQQGRLDSADLYYTRLLQHLPLYCYAYTAEAYFSRKTIAEVRGDWQTASSFGLEDLYAADCCEHGEIKDPSSCDQHGDCLYYLYSFINHRIEEFTDGVGTESLISALNLARIAVERYENSLKFKGDEEAALNKSIYLGDRLINAALRAAFVQLQEQPTSNNYNFLLECMEIGKTYLLTEELAQRNLEKTGPSMATLSQRAVSNETAIRLLKARTERADTVTQADVLEFHQMIQQRRIYSDTILRQRQRIVKLANPSDAIPTVDLIRRELAVNEAFLEFADTDRDTYAFYIDRDTQVVYQIDQQTVGPAVDTFGTLLTSLQQLPEIGRYSRLASQLYQNLLGPIERLAQDRSKLLISPSASMEGLPFATLIGSKNDTATDYRQLDYTLDKWVIRYVASWRTERRMATRRRQLTQDNIRRAGIWTHPNLSSYFNDVTNEVLAKVARTTASLPQPSQGLLNFWERAGTFDLLHITAHAANFSYGRNQNFLYLTSTDSLNGLVVAQQDLNARLVVLAACSTTRGEAFRREGTFSLQRSFHLAGVPDVVVSLYDLPAAATAEALRAFYEELAADEGKSDYAHILTLAQRRSRLGDLGKRYVFPGYWAGMVVG